MRKWMMVRNTRWLCDKLPVESLFEEAYISPRYGEGVIKLRVLMSINTLLCSKNNINICKTRSVFGHDTTLGVSKLQCAADVGSYTTHRLNLFSGDDIRLISGLYNPVTGFTSGRECSIPFHLRSIFCMTHGYEKSYDHSKPNPIKISFVETDEIHEGDLFMPGNNITSIEFTGLIDRLLISTSESYYCKVGDFINLHRGLLSKKMIGGSYFKVDGLIVKNRELLESLRFDVGDYFDIIPTWFDTCRESITGLQKC